MTKELVFITLAQKYEQEVEKLNELRERLNAAMADVGVGNYAQCLNTLAVYKIYEPTGTFVSFKKLDYKRTNVGDEKRGGSTVLSKKDAQEAGFDLIKFSQN